MVNVIEPLDIQAAFPGPVRTQPGQHRPMPGLELADQIDDQVLAARRETGQRPVALMTAGVPVVVHAETDDARSPHGRRLTGDLPHQGAQPARILASLLIGHSGQELVHGGIGTPHRRSPLGRHTAIVTQPIPGSVSIPARPVR